MKFIIHGDMKDQPVLFVKEYFHAIDVLGQSSHITINT